MRKLAILTLVVTIGMIFTSCCACKKYQKTHEKPFESTQWVLVQLDGKEFSRPDDNSFFVVFNAEGKLNGRGSCNSFFSDYQKTETNQLTIGEIGSTRAFCPDQESEDKFLMAISQADSFKMDGSLMLLFKDSKVTAVMEGIAAPKTDKKQ